MFTTAYCHCDTIWNRLSVNKVFAFTHWAGDHFHPRHESSHSEKYTDSNFILFLESTSWANEPAEATVSHWETSRSQMWHINSIDIWSSFCPWGTMGGKDTTDAIGDAFLSKNTQMNIQTLQWERLLETCTQTIMMPWSRSRFIYIFIEWRCNSCQCNQMSQNHGWSLPVHLTSWQ